MPTATTSSAGPLYGGLEDETPFQSVRRFVEYEDFTLLRLTLGGVPTPATHGFVEITPEREYMIVMDFYTGAQEIENPSSRRSSG